MPTVVLCVRMGAVGFSVITVCLDVQAISSKFLDIEVSKTYFLFTNQKLTMIVFQKFVQVVFGQF